MSFCSRASIFASRFSRVIYALPYTACVLISLKGSRLGVGTTLGLQAVFTGEGFCPIVSTIICGSDFIGNISGLIGFGGRSLVVGFVNDSRRACSRGIIFGSSIRTTTLGERLG